MIADTRFEGKLSGLVGNIIEESRGRIGRYTMIDCFRLDLEGEIYGRKSVVVERGNLWLQKRDFAVGDRVSLQGYSLSMDSETGRCSSEDYLPEITEVDTLENRTTNQMYTKLEFVEVD
jgi:hypothetical protein